MDRVRLLDDSHKRRRLAFTFFHVHFAYFRQAAAEVIAPMAKIELSADVNNIALAQFWCSTGIALRLNFLESDFAGASLVGCIEMTICFGALICFRHFFLHLERSERSL